MGDLAIERLGGQGNFGPKSRVRSHGRVSFDALSEADQETVKRLFETRGAVDTAPGGDAFHYLITRQTPAGPETIDAPDHAVPEALITSVRDELV